MDSEKKIAARDKLVSKACSWLDCRNAKAGLTGKAREAAKGRQVSAECELAEATEKYKKEN